MKRPILAGVLSIFLFSCQSGKELHYFRQGENYYRINVKEWAFLSSSRYQSGYFDELALDRYFGEIRRPDTTGSFLKYNMDSNGKLMSAPPNTKLVMVLSTDASAVKDQISAFAENDQTLEIIARLANKGTIAENNTLRNEIVVSNNSISSIRDFGEITLAGLSDSLEKKEGNLSNILLFMNKVASKYGNKIAFKTLDEANNWFINKF